MGERLDDRRSKRFTLAEERPVEPLPFGSASNGKAGALRTNLR
jgi:hypothetical protein